MKKIIFIILSFIAFWTCQKLDPLKPTDELSMNYGKLVEDTLYSTADTFLVNDRINTYSAIKLCIGNYENFESAILLKFIDLPDSGTTVDSIAIEFSTLSVQGEASADMQVALYKVDNEWYENANTEDQWHSFNPTTEIGTIHIPSEDSTRVKFEITDTTVINEWISDGLYNNGLYLKCINPGINYIREIASMEYGVDSLAPQITIRYWSVSDSTFITDTTYIGLDATIFNNNGNDLFNRAKTNHDILVASGIGARTYLQFHDLNMLPQNIVIQKADLYLPISDNSFTNPGQPNNFDNRNNPQAFYINLVADSGDVLTTTELDSVYLNLVSLAATDSIVQTNSSSNRAWLGKYFIQSIVNDDINSEWLSIQFADEGQDLSIKRFKRLSESPARLVIKYFQVEQTGF